jgi:hypothetical protein
MTRRKDSKSEFPMGLPFPVSTGSTAMKPVVIVTGASK